MKVSLVVAMSENRVIGKDGKVPWHIREDLRHLKMLVKDHVVILGRKTFDSLVWYYDQSGRPMPARLYIIVTNNKAYQPARDNTRVVHSVQEALEAATREKEAEVFVIGGQKIFEQILPQTDKIYLTLVKGNVAGDTFFPDYSDFTKVVSKEEGESEGQAFTFLDLERADEHHTT